MMGHHLNVFIGVALNVSDQPIEFKEALCGELGCGCGDYVTA